MHRNTRSILGALVIALSLPITASAQSLQSPYRFLPESQNAGVFATYVWPSHGRLGAGPDAGAGFGARWGIGISGPLAFELEGMFVPLTRPVVDTTYVLPDSSRVVKGAADMGLLIGMANVRVNLTGTRSWHGIQPFGLFGAGIATDLKGENGADTLVVRDARFGFGTSFAGNVGAGFEWFASDRIAARLDGGMLLWKLKAPNAFITQSGTQVIPPSEWEQNFKMSAGLSWHF